MVNNQNRGSTNDPTTVTYEKKSQSDDTVIMPDRLEPVSISGAVVGSAGTAGAKNKDADKTVFMPAAQQAGSAEPNQEFDPAVGWLVVLDGPGRGESRVVYYGQNSIGRGPNMRIPIDFGDTQISREAHAFLIYDDKERKYYLKDNGQSNIMRLNDDVVVSPREIRDRDLISIGQTTLLFIALCDANFDWLRENAP